MRALGFAKERLSALRGFVTWPRLNAAAGAALLVALGIHIWLANRVDRVEEKVQFMKGEVAKLDKEIAEINLLKDEITVLLSRARIVETLNRERQWAGELFDELARRRPNGIYLRAVDDEGLRLDIAGFAASHDEVGRFIGNLEASPILGRPQLVEAKADASKAGYPVRFALSVPLRGRLISPPASVRASSLVHPGDPR